MGSAGRLAADSLRFSLAGLSPEMTATQPSSWRPRRRHSFYDAVLPRKAHFPMVEPFLEVLSREPEAGVPVARLTSPGTPSLSGSVSAKGRSREPRSRSGKRPCATT
jgi:hypothetical protein